MVETDFECYKVLNTRVAISYSLLADDVAYSRELLKKLGDICRNVYVVYFGTACDNKLKKAIIKNLNWNDVIICPPACRDEFLLKWKITLLFAETSTDIREIYSVVKKENDRKLNDIRERKSTIEAEISRGVRGTLPSEQRPWKKFSTPDLLNPALPKMSIYSYLYHSNKSFSQNNALQYFGKHISYKELFENIDACAKALLNLGVRAGDTVAMAVPNIPESVYMIYAIAKIGAIADIIDPRRSPLSINGMLSDAKPKVFVAIDSAELNANIESCIHGTTVQKVIHISPSNSLPTVLATLYRLKNKPYKKDDAASGVGHLDYQAFIKQGHCWSGVTESQYIEGSTAVIVYTSGTTGKPKGIKLSHDAINASACICVPFIEDMQPEDTFLGMMPVFMSFGVVNGMHYPLIVGQELILIPQWSENEFPDLLQKHKPNHVSSVPKCWSLVADCIENGKYTDFSFLKTPMSGADALPEATHQRINAMLKKAYCNYPLSNGYGASQVCAGVVAPSYDPATTCPLSTGIPIGNTVVAIFDQETHQELSYNTDGEIWICSATAMSGYLNETSNKNDFCEYKGLKWWRTGDIGHLDNDGHLFVVGRMTDAIATKSGTKISPSYVSEAILGIGEYSGKLFGEDEIQSIAQLIKDCVVVGVECKDGDLIYHLPVAHIVLTENTADTNDLSKKLSAYIEEVIDKKHVPHSYCFQTEDLPLTPAKKVDIKALRKRGIPKIGYASK